MKPSKEGACTEAVNGMGIMLPLKQRRCGSEAVAASSMKYFATPLLRAVGWGATLAGHPAGCVKSHYGDSLWNVSLVVIVGITVGIGPAARCQREG